MLEHRRNAVSYIHLSVCLENPSRSFMNCKSIDMSSIWWSFTARVDGGQPEFAGSLPVSHAWPVTWPGELCLTPIHPGYKRPPYTTDMRML